MTSDSSVTTAAYHFAGIGGVGMSALAEFLSASGASVSGSDRSLAGPAIEPLRRMGVSILPQDGSGLHPDTVLVYSTAIEEDNADLLRAKELGCECCHRAELMARLAEGKRVLAVSGTAGKTTMTALLGWVLTSAGYDPSVINGGILLNWRHAGCLGASRVGQSDLVIVEADESDRSFLRLHPDWAIISNLARDHFNYDETVALFKEFAGQCRAGIVAGPEVQDILGLTADALSIRNLPASAVQDGAVEVEGRTYRVPMPGLHNAINAGLVIECCRAVGVEPAAIQAGLDAFTGVHRRMEKVGSFLDVDVYDDYAHNSMKMKAAIETLQARYPSVTVFWRPHGYGPLRMMFDDLREMFGAILRPVDRLLILPVYYAGGTADRSLESDQLVKCLQEDGAPVTWVESYAELSAAILACIHGPGAVLGMGARDPQIPEFLATLVD